MESRAPAAQHVLTNALLTCSFFLVASCHQLTNSAGGDEHLLPQRCTSALNEPGEEIRPTKYLFSFFFQDSFSPDYLPKQACWWTCLCRKATRVSWYTNFAIIGNHILGYVSLTLRRKSPWTTTWKTLWTGLKSALLKQKQCREKPRPWDLISNFDGSLLACTLLATLPHAAVEPRQCQPVLPSQAFQPRCHHYLPPAWVLGMTLTSNITDYKWNKLHVNWLWESRIINLPVVGPT